MSEDRLSPPWQKKLLGEVATCILGGTPSTEIPQFWDGSIPWMASGDVNLRRVHDVSGRITEAGLASSNATMTEPPAVAVGLAGQGKTRGTVALTLRRLCTNQSIALLKGDERNLLTEFLFHDLDRRYEELRARSSGGGRGGLSKGILVKVPMTLPSVPEQSKIAEILDTLDAAIRETEAVAAKLKAMKQGLLHDLLTRGIDANGDLRPPQPEAPNLYKQTPLGWLPMEWDVRTIKDLARSSAIGPFGSDLVASDYRAEGIPVIFVRDIKPDAFFWKSHVFLDERKAQSLAAHKVTSGDVVATKMGFPPCIAAVYPNDLPDGIITADVVCIRPNQNLVKAEWLSISMNSPRVQRQVDQITAGVTRPKVTLRDVRELKVALPLLGEQRAILERTRAVDAEIGKNAAMLDKLRLQKFGLMDDLLTGRVPVTPLL